MNGSPLFSPLRLRGLELRNRVAVSPMCMYSATDGLANDWHLVHLGTRASGGAGLVIVEATGVEPEGRISPGCLGLWDDAQIEPLRRIVEFLHSQGAKAGIQLAHAGRKGSCAVPSQGEGQLSLEQGGWKTVAPSALPFREGERAPHALTVAEIAGIRASFVAAARRAQSAGFDTIELHNAHGYLGHEFLSPLSNQRTDEYGGPFENRVRFTLETVDALRAAWPDQLPLLVRISATDWVEGGWDIDQTVQLAALLKEHGVDLLDCSSGAIVPHATIPWGPDFQVPFAERVRKETGLASGAVGFITQARQAEAIIAEGRADLVLMARELLRNPYWPILAAKELGAPPPIPAQYLRAF